MEVDLPHLLLLSRNVSKHSNCKVRVGAVLVKHSKPISVGFNKVKYNKYFSHPYKETIHAEMSCLKTAEKTNINGCDIFVYRERKDGTIGLARPCEDCLTKLKEYGIKRIYYSTDDYPYWNSERI
jgi:deoxycytidylate deaminase